jgi:hypothetical protein
MCDRALFRKYENKHLAFALRIERLKEFIERGAHRFDGADAAGT